MATKNYRKVKRLHENRRSGVSLEERWPVNGPKFIQRQPVDLVVTDVDRENKIITLAPADETTQPGEQLETDSSIVADSVELSPSDVGLLRETKTEQ